MTQYYSNPERESDPHALPDLEVFHCCAGELPENDEGEPSAAGWYYWYCFPGCMPDSDAIGPFATEAEAVAAARDEASE